MHVALNGYFWNRPNTGSGQYTRQLVYHLHQLVSDLTLTLVYPQTPDAPAPLAVPPGVNVHAVPMRPGHLGKVLFEQRDFPRACRAAGVDVAHVPYWGGPLRCPAPVVVTIHDLTTRLVREYRRGLNARLYNALVSAGARGANHIITDSIASQRDVTRHLGIPDANITPIYLGIGPEFTPRGNVLLDMAIAQKYQLPDSYVLYLGGYEIHKNINTLLLAYTYVAAALGEEYPLLLAGAPPERATQRFPDYAHYIRRLNLEPNVRWIGHVDEADKPAVYRQAAAFVFPSRFEGFGLPPLEAMACGAPVITTTAGSLPEVVGDAAFTVSPDNERDLAGAIIAVLIQTQLAAELKRKGLAQAARFSWQTTAHQTVLVYDRVAGGKPG